MSSILAVPPARTPKERLSLSGGWLAFFLALAMLGSMVEALNAAAWSEGLGAVRGAVFGGALLAFLLALTRWKGIFPFLYSLLASIAWNTTLINQAVLPSLNLHESIQELIKRNVMWLTALISGGPSADNLIFVMQLCYLGWWLGYLALWSLVRHQRLLHAIMPSGLALLVNLYYSPLRLSGYLLAYLVTTLLLAIRVELARNETRWQLARIRYAPDIYIDFLKAGLVFALTVIALAWTMPRIADRVNMERLLRPFEEPWHTIEDTWSRMYQALNYPAAAVSTTVFGKSVTLGGAVALSDRPIFEARTTRRTYWRAVTYDTYTGQSWLNTDEDVTILERYEPLGEPVPYMTYELTVTVQLLEEGQNVIFAPPQPLRVSLPLNADINIIRQDEDHQAMTVSMLRSRAFLEYGSSYQVVSAITLATVEQLRAASSTYPEWVLKRYLQLPDTLPARVRELAWEITAPYDNPYDKASALEYYLRQYTYNQQIPAPPPETDGVDYFLFELRQGYCDYYASAMVVMLRAIGIPARFVVGYTPGEELPLPEEQMGSQISSGIYRVVERNAHAWPEVYFPQYGWIQFEPTPSEPLLVRPVARPTEMLGPAQSQQYGGGMDSLDDLKPEREDLELGPIMAERTDLIGWIEKHLPVAVTGTLLPVLILIGWLARHLWRRSLLRDNDLPARLFAFLTAWAHRLHIPWPESHTPLEHAATWSLALPQTKSVINRLIYLFVAQQYGRQQPSAETLAATLADWERLQPLLWQCWLMRWIRRSSPNY